MSELASKRCVPCQGGVPSLPEDEVRRLLKELNGWSVIQGYHLTRTFALPDFKFALDLVNRIGELAEEQGHHPDIHLSWGKVCVELWTHKISGLTESDFILAAKIDKLVVEQGT